MYVLQESSYQVVVFLRWTEIVTELFTEVQETMQIDQIHFYNKKIWYLHRKRNRYMKLSHPRSRCWAREGAGVHRPSDPGWPGRQPRVLLWCRPPNPVARPPNTSLDPKENLPQDPASTIPSKTSFCPGSLASPSSQLGNQVWNVIECVCDDICGSRVHPACGTPVQHCPCQLRPYSTTVPSNNSVKIHVLTTKFCTLVWDAASWISSRGLLGYSLCERRELNSHYNSVQECILTITGNRLNCTLPFVDDLSCDAKTYEHFSKHLD